MKDIISTLTEEEIHNNFEALTDEFVEELVVLLYNSDITLAEKVYAEMQSKLDEEELVSDLIGCLDKIKDLGPLKEYLRSHAEYITEEDEAETLFWLFCDRKDKDEAEYWRNQIENSNDFNKAKQHYEAFFAVEKLSEKIINEEEKLYFTYSDEIISRVVQHNNKVIDVILKQLQSSDIDSEEQKIIYSLLKFADENTGPETEQIISHLPGIKLSATNRLFLINILLKKGNIEEALSLYNSEYKGCINEIAEHKGSFQEIGKTLVLLKENNALSESHSEEYKTLIKSYSGADFSNFAAPLYSLDSIKEFLQQENNDGNISSNQLAMIMAYNGRIKEALAVLEKGNEENAHIIWRLICLLSIENKELFFECLESKLSKQASKAELLLKMAGYYLTEDMDLAKKCIKEAEKLIPDLNIYFQNIYGKETALLYYKAGDVSAFKATYAGIDSLLARIQLLNTASALA